MGRLVKAVSRNTDDARPTFDEGRFLQEAGQIAARLQSELTGDRLRAGRRPRSESLAREYREELGVPDGNESAPEASQTESRPAQEPADRPGLRVYADPEQAEPIQASDESVGDKRRVMAALRDGLQAEVEAEQLALEGVKERIRSELSGEQARWTDRHSRESRNLQEQTDKLAEWAEALRDRESRLSAQEQALSQMGDQIRAEVASEAESAANLRPADQSRLQIAQDQLEASQQQAADRTAETRRLQRQTRELQEQIESLQATHAAEILEIRRRMTGDERRVERGQAIMEECDVRLAELADLTQKTHEELAREKAEFEEEQQRVRQEAQAEFETRELELTRRRDELASERLDHRAELRKVREEQLGEIQTARSEFERERDTTMQKLEHEQQEWSARFEREQDELLELRETVERAVGTQREDMQREKSEWESRLAELQARIREEEVAHEEAVENSRAELTRLAERERDKLATRRDEVERLERETSDRCDRTRKAMDDELVSKRTAWIEQQESERQALESEKASLKLSVEKLQSVLNDRRRQHEQSLQDERGRVEQELACQREQNEIELTSQRQRTIEWVQQETARFEQQRLQVTQETETERRSCAEWVSRETARIEHERQEIRTSLDAERKVFEDERLEWQQERGREAAILQTARQEHESERARLEVEQDRIEAERNNLEAEFDRRRADHEQQLQRTEQLHQEGLQQTEREMQGRHRVLNEKVQQTEAELASRCRRVEEEIQGRQRLMEEKMQQAEAELAARCRRVEDELRVMRELHEKQLQHDKEAFGQACARRNAEIEHEKSRQQHASEKLAAERREFASQADRARRNFAENVERARGAFDTETDRVRKQLDQERRVLVSGLNQMNAQFRSVAASAGMELPDFELSAGHRSAVDLESLTGRLTAGDGPSRFRSDALAEFSIPPVELVDSASSIDLQNDSPPDYEEEFAAEPVRVTSPDRVDVFPGETADASSLPVDGDVHSDPQFESNTAHSVEPAFTPANAGVADQSAVSQLVGPAASGESDSSVTTEWACIVGSHPESPTGDGEKRRQALEGYRNQLGELQSQLQDLAGASARQEES